MTQIVIDTSFGLIKLMFDNHELVRVEQAQSKQSNGRISKMCCNLSLTALKVDAMVWNPRQIGGI